jgi:hypothetical protein
LYRQHERVDRVLERLELEVVSGVGVRVDVFDREELELTARARRERRIHRVRADVDEEATHARRRVVVAGRVTVHAADLLGLARRFVGGGDELRQAVVFLAAAARYRSRVARSGGEQRQSEPQGGEPAQAWAAEARLGVARVGDFARSSHRRTHRLFAGLH